MELTELQYRLDDYNRKNGTDLMIDVEYSGNDGIFKYYIGNWDYERQGVYPEVCFHNYKEMKQYILKNY